MGRYLIHYSHWADQPSVLLACGAEADTWNVLYPELDKEFGSAEAHGYTFNRKKVTCKSCKIWIKQNPELRYKQSFKVFIKILFCFHKWRVFGTVFRCKKCNKVKL